MTTNGAMVREHMAHLRRTNARPTTMTHRRDNIERLARALPCTLVEATADELQQWQDDLCGQVSPSTISTYTSHVRVFYAWAVSARFLGENPARELRAPRLRPGKARPIAEDPLRVAIACADPVMTVWLILAAFCGLRAGEIARLRHEDIGDETLEVDGKGGHPRTVPLPAVVRTALVPFMAAPGVLWRNEHGRPVTARYVSNRSARHLRGCGTGATLHMLRHRYATRMYQLSKDPKMVQDVLGHASLDTTTRYLAVAAERGRTTADQLAAELRTTRRTSTGGELGSVA